MAKAKNGDTVRVHYKGSLEDGKVFENSFEGGEPMEFTLGQERIITGFENTVEGMEEGETRTVTIPSEEAYGEYRDDLSVTVDKSRIPQEITPEVGMVLQVPTQEGVPVNVTVTQVDENSVTLDGNHPLAGKNLSFEIKLEEIVMETASSVTE
jgi:peptidylprolyl isomerase